MSVLRLIATIRFTQRIGVATVPLALAITINGCGGREKSPVAPIPPAALTPRYSGGGIGGTYLLAVAQATNPDANGFPRLGQCLGTEAFSNGIPSGMKSETDLNCTSNDLSIDRPYIDSVSTDGGVTYFGFEQGFSLINCVPGQAVFLRTGLYISQNTTAPRNDIGIWTPIGGNPSAMTGYCFAWTLKNGSPGVADLDGDQCGDLVSGSRIKASFGVTTTICPSDGSSSIHTQVCIAWSQAGSDQICPLPGTAYYRPGALPGSKSKCNCTDFEIAVNLVQ